jgi:MFS family permease
MMRPRVLYFAVFVFHSLSGGRFTSTFLEHQLGFTAKRISTAISIQMLVSNVCKPWLGKVADSWEASVDEGRGNTGRLRVMSLGLLLSTVAMLSHGLGSIIYSTKTINDIGDIETDEKNLQWRGGEVIFGFRVPT